jgi:hypothetical protein
LDVCAGAPLVALLREKAIKSELEQKAVIDLKPKIAAVVKT